MNIVQLLTACKQYSPAAGATQGYVAHTQTVSSTAYSATRQRIIIGYVENKVRLIALKSKSL